MLAVETFECQETASEPIEATEEAVALMDELGLEGQRQLVRPKDDRPVARSPYREMTEEENFVYSVLCPTRTKLQKYAASPVPLRVLQIAAHCKSLGLFEELEVWDRESITVKDPVLVAYGKDPEYTWRRKTYILARWGEELETFSVLLKRTIQTKREQFAEAAKQITSQVAAETARIAAMTPADIMALGAAAKLQMGFTQS